MTDNLRIWNAVAKTDPAHTKKVEFGRKFTSIDAHWQIMRATETFGPIGEGWGYSVQHSTITLAPEMILAIADVTIWWSGQDDDPGVKRGEYGPIRATCEMWGVVRDKGRMLYEVDGETPKMRADEDAPKKAMTDALTKGLSHLGFSADVFLGLFDDNRYVQKVAKEFAQEDWENDKDITDNLRLDGRDDDGNIRSTYDTNKAAKAKTYADDLITVLNTATKDEARKVWTENWRAPAGKRVSPLAWLELHAPDQFQRVSQAHENAVA